MRGFSVSGNVPTNSSRIMIIDSQKYGISPAMETFDVTWIGNLSYANLHVDFSQSFGYGLSDAILNGTKLPITNAGVLDADVRFLLNQGSNKLTVDFADLQLLGQPLGSTIITAYIDYYGASVLKIPSVNQELTNLVNDVKSNIPLALTVIIGGAIALASIAYVASRLPSAGDIKISDVSKSASKAAKHVSNIAHETHSKIKHLIMTTRDSS